MDATIDAIEISRREDIAAELERLRDIESLAHVLAPILERVTVSGSMEDVTNFLAARLLLIQSLIPIEAELPPEVRGGEA